MALLVSGSVAYVEVVIGLLADGVIPVPMDPKLTPAERRRLLPYVDPAMVVDDQARLDALHAEVGRRDGLPLARPMQLTSGTTGSPKGVHSGVLEAAAATALLVEERELWGFRADDVNLVLSPLHHSAPLRFAMGTVLAGGEVVVPGPFDVAAATDAIIERDYVRVDALPHTATGKVTRLELSSLLPPHPGRTSGGTAGD